MGFLINKMGRDIGKSFPAAITHIGSVPCYFLFAMPQGAGRSLPEQAAPPASGLSMNDRTRFL